MKQKMFMVLIFALSLSVVGCTESTQVEKGETNLNSLVNQIDINDYFIHHNKYWKVCWDHKQKIRDREEGYVSEEYGGKQISNIVDGVSYTWDIYKSGSNYKMDVKLSCDFTVFYAPNVFLRVDEDVSYDGGTVVFNMNIKETENGRYVLQDMKAIDHYMD